MGIPIWRDFMKDMALNIAFEGWIKNFPWERRERMLN